MKVDLSVCVHVEVGSYLEFRLWSWFAAGTLVYACVCCRGKREVTSRADTTTELAGRQEKKSFPEDVRETA